MMRQAKHTKNRKDEGFTLIEIICAMAVFMIGVMGMVALQGVSIHAAAKGRQQTAAVAVARYFIAELKSEFAAWDTGTVGFPNNPFPDEFALLDSAASGTNITTNTWIQFGADGSGGLRLDELLGHSQLSDGGAARFCVGYMLTPLENHPDGTPLNEYSVWQIRVRVSWTKEGHYQAGNVNWNDCSIASVNARIVTVGSDDVIELVSTATREFAR